MRVYPDQVRSTSVSYIEAPSHISRITSLKLKHDGVALLSSGVVWVAPRESSRCARSHTPRGFPYLSMMLKTTALFT